MASRLPWESEIFLACGGMLRYRPQPRDSLKNLPKPCLVPKLHYCARPMRFGSRGSSEFSPGRSPRIRHRNALTEKAWEDALQGLGKPKPTTAIGGLEHPEYLPLQQVLDLDDLTYREL